MKSTLTVPHPKDLGGDLIHRVTGKVKTQIEAEFRDIMESEGWSVAQLSRESGVGMNSLYSMLNNRSILLDTYEKLYTYWVTYQTRKGKIPAIELTFEKNTQNDSQLVQPAPADYPTHDVEKTLLHLKQTLLTQLDAVNVLLAGR